MIDAPELSILAAALAAMRASPAVAEAFDGAPALIFDTPDAGAGDDETTEGPFPFIRTGDFDTIEGERIENDEGEVDDPAEVNFDVHVFDRGPNRNVRAKQLARAVRLALARELELEGPYRVTLGESRGVRHFTERDGLTAHAVVSLRYLVETSEN